MLQNDSLKYHAKRDRRVQRATFRDITQYVKVGCYCLVVIVSSFCVNERWFDSQYNFCAETPTVLGGVQIRRGREIDSPFVVGQAVLPHALYCVVQ